MKKILLILLLLSNTAYSKEQKSIESKKRELKQLQRELKTIIEERKLDTEIVKLKQEREQYKEGLTENSRQEYRKKKVTKLIAGPHHKIFIGIPIKYLSISSTDLSNQSQATIGTAPITGIVFSWEQVWNEIWKTTIEADIDYVQYKGDANHSLDNDKELLPSLFMGTSMKFRSKWDFFAKIGASKQTFIRGQSGNITLDHNFLKKGKIGIKREIISNKKTKLAVELSGQLSMPLKSPSYNLGMGIGYEGKLVLERRLSTKIFKIEAVYSSESQSSSITKQSISGFAIKAGFSIPF